MKKQFGQTITHLSFVFVALMATTYLSACQKKGSGGTSPIEGVPARPAAPAKPADSSTSQEVLETEEGQAGVSEQMDPQVAGSGPTSAANTAAEKCFWGDEPICSQETADSGKEDENAETGADLAVDEYDEYDEYEEGTGVADAGETVTDVQYLSRAYTGASSDGYRQHLTLTMADRMKASEKKNEYYATAESIVRVKAYLQGEIVQVSVVRKESDGEKTTILGGLLNQSAGAARLTDQSNSLSRASGLDPSVFGTTLMKGTAVCVDSVRTDCFIMLIRLEIGENKVPVWVIHRTTNADIHMKKKENFGGKQELRNFYNYFANTKRQVLDSVKTVVVDSFEVIHGASGMKITALMNDNQVVSARGKLMAPEQSILTNVPWKLDLEIQDLYDQDARTGFKSDLQNTLSSAHLITNDGKKEFTLSYGLRSNTEGVSGELDVTYLRIHPVVKSIDQIRNVFQGLSYSSEL